MRTFSCPVCSTVVFFDSIECESCGTGLLYAPADDAFVVDQGGGCSNVGTPERCNWVAQPGLPRCLSCGLDTVTADGDAAAGALREPFQSARRRTVRQLLALGVPLDQPPALGFALLDGTDTPVMTGHEDGLITLDITEGDRVHLESVRAQMGEPYRTPLGHVRHEIGHWYWQAFVDTSFTTDDFRARFGDERGDYADALAAHYGAPDDGSWQSDHISHYAAAHPWEDFAESFAHHLHITGTLETAVAHGLVAPGDDSFEDMYRRWVDCTTALNELNRSMGTPDAYPFVAAQPAIDKIRFVADAIAGHGTHTAAAASAASAERPKRTT